MSLFKPKGSKYWYFDFVYKGRRYYGSTGVAGKTAAQRIEEGHRRRAAEEAAHGKPLTKATMTLAEAFGRYYTEVSQHISIADADLTRSDVLMGILGQSTEIHMVGDNLLADTVAKLRARTIGTGEKERLVSNATVNRYIEFFRRVWRRAHGTWKVECGDQPAWGALLLDEADERIRSLSADEETRLFAALRPDYHPIVRFAIKTGIRCGNLRDLKWRDVDWNAREITIRMKSRKPGGRAHIIPLTDELIADLQAERGKHFIYVFTYQCERPRRTRDEDGKPIVRTKGAHYPFSRDGWRRAWNNALAAAEIEDFRFHDTRHTAATRIVRITGNIKVASKLLGHTNIATTARYAHVDADDIRAALNAVSQAIPKVGTGEDENIEEKQETKTA